MGTGAFPTLGRDLHFQAQGFGARGCSSRHDIYMISRACTLTPGSRQLRVKRQLVAKLPDHVSTVRMRMCTRALLYVRTYVQDCYSRDSLPELAEVTQYPNPSSVKGSVFRKESAMVFEGVLVDVLNHFLRPYLKNLDASQLRVGIWSGKCVLNGIILAANVCNHVKL